MSTAAEGPLRVRALTDLPSLAERAARLLRMPETRLPLSDEEAQQVVACMGLIPFAAGSVVLREGEGQRADYLLLVLEGDLQVGTTAGFEGEPIPLSVIGPGSIVGEMSLIDGAPRSATCIAVGAVTAAGLSRAGLELLIDQHPRAAAKLLLGLAQRLADRLRALGQQIQIVSRL